MLRTPIIHTLLLWVTGAKAHKIQGVTWGRGKVANVQAKARTRGRPINTHLCKGSVHSLQPVKPEKPRRQSYNHREIEMYVTTIVSIVLLFPLLLLLRLPLLVSFSFSFSLLTVTAPETNEQQWHAACVDELFKEQQNKRNPCTPAPLRPCSPAQLNTRPLQLRGKIRIRREHKLTSEIEPVTGCV